YGRIDIAFNNAGVIQKISPLTEIEDVEYERIMAINMKGVFLGLKYVLKVMEEQGSGSIINTASTAGICSEHSMAVYSSS
ncbi:SDR family oxidoreductase, partial [Bacillus thuringiensis]|uniref:SDR family oxidoreductase n=1 Tax=Bacillus thuringiensis TaxID=1428 RepID=UPI0020BDD142